jgi:hypothetical protein
MNKPKGYTVFDLEHVIDWMYENEFFNAEQADRFRDDVLDFSKDIVFLSTEDCVRISGLRVVLNEFGTKTWKNRAGIDIYEIHLVI